MDIHPLVLHYPIALLTLYSLFELISVRKLQEKQYWFYVKAIFVFFGTLGAIAVALAGRASPLRFGELFELHLIFTYVAVVIYGIISALYLMVWFGEPKLTLRVGKLVFDRWIMLPLAIGGLIAVALLGGFAGAGVYGTAFDPLMGPIFRLFNL